MAGKSQRPQGNDGVFSPLNMAIDTLNLAKVATNVTPAKAAFTSASVLLTMIRVGSFRFMLVNRRLTYTGLNDLQIGLRRTRTNLRQRLGSS